MATRQTFANEIVTRARRLNWSVQPGKWGGWLINCPDKHQVQVHTSPSDRNAADHIMAELNAHGFAEAEAEYKRLDEAERLAKIEEDRRKNQEKLDLAQKRADLLSRASGQQRVSIDVLTKPTSMPKTFERVLITPKMAESILVLNTSNRPLRSREVKTWAELITRGDWKYTHQGVAIDSGGVLQDGQHRLAGIVAADIQCEMQVSVGMPPENFAAIDNGLRRTFGDVVYGHGVTKSAARVGTVVRMLTLYAEYPRRLMNDKVANTEISDYMMRDFRDTDVAIGEVIVDAVHKAHYLWQIFRINNAAASAAMVWLWEKYGTDHPAVNDFFDGLRTGEMLPATDARMVLRRILMSPTYGNRSSVHHFAMLIKAWNKYLKHADVKVLSFRKDEDMPKFDEIPEDFKIERK